MPNNKYSIGVPRLHGQRSRVKPAKHAVRSVTFRVVPAATPESDGEWFEFTPDGVCYAHYPESSTPLKVVKWLERMVETEDYVG